MKAKVYSSWGVFEMDTDTGNVLKWTPEPTMAKERAEFDNAQIFRFDIEEWKAYYPKVYLASYLESRGGFGFDILDLGYWYWFKDDGVIKRSDPNDHGYQQPEHRWRREFGDRAQAGDVHANNDYEQMLARVNANRKLKAALKAPCEDSRLLRTMPPGALAQLSREIGLWDCSVAIRRRPRGDLVFTGPGGAAITLNPLLVTAGKVRQLAKIQ